jgi:DNA-binding transcriptional MerR regulator
MSTTDLHYIGDVAKRLGITQRSIRYYEERGLIHPARTEGRFRVYAKSEVERLKTVLLLKDLGVSLDEISSLIKLWHEGVSSEVAPKVREALHMRLDDFKAMEKKYRKGIEQLTEVLNVLTVCETCGHAVAQSTCRHCLEGKDKEIPPLMKTLL